MFCNFYGDYSVLGWVSYVGLGRFLVIDVGNSVFMFDIVYR